MGFQSTSKQTDAVVVVLIQIFNSALRSKISTELEIKYISKIQFRTLLSHSRRGIRNISRPCVCGAERATRWRNQRALSRPAGPSTPGFLPSPNISSEISCLGCRSVVFKGVEFFGYTKLGPFGRAINQTGLRIPPPQKNPTRQPFSDQILDLIRKEIRRKIFLLLDCTNY